MRDGEGEGRDRGRAREREKRGHKIQVDFRCQTVWEVTKAKRESG